MRNDMNGPLPNGTGHGCVAKVGETMGKSSKNGKNDMDFVVSGKTIDQFVRMRVNDMKNMVVNSVKAHKAEKASMFSTKAAKAMMTQMIATKAFWNDWVKETEWYSENDIAKVNREIDDAMQSLRPLTMDAKELKAYETKMADLDAKLADLLAEKAALDQL